MNEPQRVHPYLATELAHLLDQWVEHHQDGGIYTQPDHELAQWLADRLEFHGWKIEPSRQRRMQLDPPVDPPPPLPHL